MPGFPLARDNGVCEADRDHKEGGDKKRDRKKKSEFLRCLFRIRETCSAFLEFLRVSYVVTWRKHDNLQRDPAATKL